MTTRSVGPEKPIEHRDPTPATVKQLYGTAFECGKPGCHADLYKVNEDTGKRVLNSRVAHIHARSEGGPRWNPDMSEADNRDADNLLLLCLLHAWEIDDIPDQYPPDLLREWKRAQVAEYERVRRNWTITDAEALEAVAPFDLRTAIDKIVDVVPFNPRMRSRVDAWQLSARKGRGRRIARLTPLVAAERRDAVLAWMAALDDPIVDVPTGQVRVLVARMGAGKTEQALRWWEQGLQVAANDADTEIPIFFTAREIISGLESAAITELGGEPIRDCRVVIDDLDGVSDKEAARLLMEARELVQVWPNVSVLATARPGIPVPTEEKSEVHPWSPERGADLVKVALGDVPWHLWTAETAELLTSPLTALALAARLYAGRDTKVSRMQLLSDLANMVIESRHVGVSDDTWQDLARLATRILGQPEALAPSSFHTRPRVRRLIATDLVVTDDGALTFALPVFEQYFGSEAIRSGMVTLETVASSESFPRWRYALAFAVSSAPGPDQEALLIGLARLNPAAAFWVLDEIAITSKNETLEGASDEAIAALIRRRDQTGLSKEPDFAIRAGLWLRQAEQALLSGLRPLADSTTTHRDSTLLQWGVRLENGYLTLARARDRPPPPEVVKLTEPHPEITIAAGWRSWKQFRFPITDLGRWLHAQNTLQEQLQVAIKRRALPVPRTSWLARERMYVLAEFVYNYDVGPRRRPIVVAELRDKVATWMAQVNISERATWESAGGSADSDDIRWLSAQLATEDSDTLEPPWPDRDQPHAGRWAWQAYSPELTLTMATGIVREALIGYRQLVDANFSAFGNAMGLYSMLPLRVEGLVGRFIDDNIPSVEMRLVLHPDPTPGNVYVSTVDLRLITSARDRTFWEFGRDHRGPARTVFGQDPAQDLELPLHVTRPATNLAYQWLTRDLAAVGWLKDRTHFFD